MGCCMSFTTKTGSHQPKAPPPPPPPPPPSHHDRCPPKSHKTHKTSAPKPASFEEETVKEVLSETPVSKPATITQPTRKRNTLPIIQQTKAKDQSFFTQKCKEEEKQATPEISQASEICSSTVTDTLSAATTATTTTTVTEIREDEATSKKRVLRSPSKVPRKRPYTGERERVSRSPASKEGLPLKRELSGQMTRSHVQRNVGSSRVRRDVHGEGSGRRSRSSATRTAAGVGRGRGVATQARGTGKASGRSIGVGAAASGVKEEKRSDGALMEQQQLQGNESLENPLVSLECFIFL